jgi:ATP-dependent exoDNAse (exonuclease V) alpha subunit
MRTAVDGIEKPVVVLAPSAEASRGVLRSEGFAAADTVARFLEDKPFQEQARGGVIWVDESGLLGFRHVARLVEIAGELNARIILQGDKRQHGSVERGSALHVLETYGGLPVAELQDIRRQQGDYKQAVKLLAKGDMAGGFDKLHAMGWVKQVDGHKALVDDYLAGLDAGKTMLVVAPTHAEGDAITAAIRNQLKERGMIGSEERIFPQLQPLGWTNAQKGDLSHYEGREILQFHRNSGTFKAGQRIAAAQWQPGQVAGKPGNYSVYEAGQLPLSPGDVVRMTAGGHDITGKHRLNNGSRYKVKGFTPAGNIQLTNGWVLAADVGHIAHGVVSTSHASQGKTVDRVLIAMGRESLPAINAEQFYVSVSRGREWARIYSDMPRDELREAVKGLRARKSATELMGLQLPAPQAKRSLWDKLRTILKKGRDRLRQLHQAASPARETTQSKEKHHGRSEREL